MSSILISESALPIESDFQSSRCIVCLQIDVGDLDVLVQLLELEVPNVRKPMHVSYQATRIVPLSAKKLVSVLKNAF